MPAMKFQFTYVIHPIQRKYYIGMYNRMYQVPNLSFALVRRVYACHAYSAQRVPSYSQ